MSSDQDPRFSPVDEPDEQFEDDDAPRSIFSAAWFRVVLVVLAVAVVGAVAVPYVLDVVSAPGNAPAPQTAAAPTTPAQPASPPPVASAPASSTTPAKSATPSEGGSAPASAAPAPVAKAPEKAVEKTPASAPVAAAPKTPPAPAAAAKKESPAPERAAPVAAAVAKATTPARTVKRSEGSGEFFVQVGAFQDQATAKRVAARLRDQNYSVDESATRGANGASASPRPTPRVAAASGPDRYDVIVSGGSTAEINSKLSAKGLAAEPAGENVRIRPSLSLRDAVALSKDLGSEGFKVQVRRGAGSPGATAAAEPAPSPVIGDGPMLYRVRVGGFPDRAAAVAVQRELQEKGYQPFIAKGRD